MSEFLTDLLYISTDKKRGSNPVYKLTAPLKYKSTILMNEPELQDIFDRGLVTVPSGFETDFASIPFPPSIIYRPDGPWKRAATVHDFLCGRIGNTKFDGLERKMADDVLYEAMRADGISRWVALLFWGYLRLVGNVRDL